MELKADPNRLNDFSLVETGVFVRAKTPDGWDSVDVVHLDSQSLLAWLRSRGGSNEWAENFVGELFDHDPLHNRTN